MKHFPGAIAAIAILTLVVACQRETKSPDAGATANAMANMPGKNADGPAAGDTGTALPGALPEHITLTSAQIEHGGVKWGAATLGRSSGSALIPGVLMPNEDHTARLGATARGRVVQVLVRPGDRVSAGQVLATLQSPEAGMAQADVGKATAEVAARRAEVDFAAAARARAERLLALKAIPRQDVERAVADDERARAALAQSESEVQRARTTADHLGVGANANGEIALRAPAAGVVLVRAATPGAVVEAGMPLIVITEPTTLWLSIDAPEPMIGMFRRNGQVRFTVSAYPGDTLYATIESVGAGLDEMTRTLNVRGVVANGTGRLKPEMLANVILDGSSREAAVVVPEAAVQLFVGKPFAFVAKPDGNGGAQFIRRAVVLGPRADGHVSVISGLNAGEIVVTDGAFAVKSEFQKATMSKMVM